MDKETTVQGLFRTDTGALINKNNEALVSYKRKKEQSKKMQELEKKVDTINDDINDIKKMIFQLLEKNKA
jgi:hypothetical protein